MPRLARPFRLLPCLASALALSTAGAWPGPSRGADEAVHVAPAPEVIDESPIFPPAVPGLEPTLEPTVEPETFRGSVSPDLFGSPWTEPPTAAPTVTVPPVVASPPAAARVNWDVAPPPGTLGRTYRQPSALIPKDEHPRTARIDVDVATLPFVEVIGLEDFDGFRGSDGLWHFKSKRPLLPGVPHIYQVIAHDGTPGGAEDVRTVRMIPGRIVRVAF